MSDGPRRRPREINQVGVGKAALFLAPYLTLFGVFIVAPIVYGLWISLHQWEFAFPNKPWVGLRNFRDLFDSTSVVHEPFWKSMRATGKFVLFSVPPLIVIPLLLAIALNSKFPGRNLLRAIVFAPFVLGVGVVGILWRYLLDPNVGVVNHYLGKLGIDSIPFTNDTPWVWLALVIPTIWWTCGYNMVIFLAGLQDIPRELYEAAEIDGAGRRAQFRNVTLPGLRPVVVFVITITILASANVFGQTYLITQGQPADATDSVIMRIRDVGFGQQNMGRAAAMSTVLTLFLMALSAIATVRFGARRRPRRLT